MVFLLFLMACGSSEMPGDEGDDAAVPTSESSSSATPVAESELTEPPAPAAGDPKYGGILFMQKHGPPGKLDPHPSVAGLDASEFAHVYDNLVQYNPFEPTDEIVPDLAESWDVSEDGLVFTFNLHDNVVWTDGEPFTADDVLFSLERMVEEGKPRPRAGLIRQYYGSSQVIDDHTIEVTLDFPAAADERQLVLPVASISFAGRDEVNHPVRRCRIDHRSTSRTIEAEAYGRKDSGDSGGQGWHLRAFGTELAEWSVALGNEAGAPVAHPVRSLRRRVGGGD